MADFGLIQIKETIGTVWLSSPMRIHFAVRVLCFAAAVALFGCAGSTDYAGGENIKIQEVEEAADRGEADKILGKPDATRNTEGRRIEAYEIYQGTRFFVIVPGPFIPLDSKYFYLTISYEADGSLLDLKTWHAVESAEDAIERHVKALREGNIRGKDVLKEVNRLKKICEVSLKQAKELEEEALRRRSIECDRYAVNWQSRYMWVCLMAQRRDASAQYSLGLYSQHQDTMSSDRLAEAYKWFSLSKSAGGAEADEAAYYLRKLSRKMTTEEITIAERMVVDWQPNPAECDPLQSLEDSPAQLN